MSKTIIFAALLTVIGVSTALINSQSSTLAPIETAAPAAPKGIYATGIVEGATEDIELRPETSGRLVELMVDVGDWVEADQVILRLDSRRQAQQVAASRAQLELAQAQLQRLVNGAREQERAEARALLAAKQARLQQAQRTWERVQHLRKQAAVSQQESDDQEGLVAALAAEVRAASAQVAQLEAPARADELRVAQARVAAAEAELELAKIALDKTQLMAPIRGQVLDVNVEPGELIGPDGPMPAVVLSDTSALRVRAYVEEIDAPQIEIGMTAEITADGIPDHTMTAHVASLSPRMQAKTVLSGKSNELYDTKVREVLLTIDSADRLIVGLRVDVMFGKLHAGSGAARTDTSAKAAVDLPQAPGIELRQTKNDL